MTYLSEFRTHWRFLLAGVVGLGSGFSLVNYITNLFAPYLLQEFGWSKSHFALTGMMALAVLFSLPLVGRMADTAGVRRTAAIGVFALPLTFLAFSAMNGPIWQYMVICLLQAIFGITTTTTVYSRLVAVPFTRARGLALSIVAASPAITAAAFMPMLTRFVEAHGWRAGYQLVAAYILVLGIVALLLIPRPAEAGPARTRQKAAAGQDYRAILRNPAFWIILVALLLCNLSQVLHLSQLKLVLLGKGATSQAAAATLSIYAISIIVGRFASGLALDRFPAYAVAAVGLGLPSIGLLLLASNLNTPRVLDSALFLMGLAFGAEGDVMGYLAVRHFGVEVYSSVLGVFTSIVATSFAIGSLILSLMLRASDSYSPFLITSAVAGLVGSGAFILLRNQPTARPSITTMVGYATQR